MSVCVFKVCRNYKGRSKTTHNVTYHRIPSDPIMRSRWTQIIQRSRCEELWKPSKYSLVCSDHFNKNEMYFVNNEGRRRLKKQRFHNSSIAFDAGSGISRDKPHINFVDMRNTSNAPENTGHWQHTKNTSNDTEIETEVYEEFSDLDSVFDTPKEAKLRRDLHRKNILQRKHILKIQSLRRKIIRLKKKITTYKEIIGNLKKEK
ncbi:uncharacterized protein LOC115451743 isoform X2 [Manduca sexta]|uniref:uncharacterized protein LOC115451743 isoform X2 n=1 Tax=Manduca sexta TaxID=7130 RepID=UPI00189060A8|nr:uncharacterized protein LOC115451743 isoform X2 [Manduca sexta]